MLGLNTKQIALKKIELLLQLFFDLLPCLFELPLFIYIFNYLEY